jgi:hypothetical protein
MQLQHVNVKLFVQNPKEVDLESLIPIFHGWIQDQTAGDLLLDIADYTHVQAGPGIILIGYDGDFSVDNTDNRLGVRYNRKGALEGSNQDRLKQAARAALIACQRLEEDPKLGGKLRFDGREVEIFINDRLIAPNNDTTRETVDMDFRQFFKHLFHGSEFSLAYGADARKLFSVSAKSSQVFSVKELLDRLAYFGL